MEASWIGPIVSVVVTLVGGGISWGVISATVKTLKVELQTLNDAIEKLTKEMDVWKNAFVELKTKHDALAMEARVGLTEKASKESVDGIKEQLAEIKGMLNSLTRMPPQRRRNS